MDQEHSRISLKVPIGLAITMAMLIASSGCFWLAVGGAGAAGYQIGKDDRSLGTKIDDASITSSVKAKLIGDEQVDAFDINVDTYQGTVTLYGHVPSHASADRAVRLAGSVKGVKKVRSELAVVPPP